MKPSALAQAKTAFKGGKIPGGTNLTSFYTTPTPTPRPNMVQQMASDTGLGLKMGLQSMLGALVNTLSSAKKAVAQKASSLTQSKSQGRAIITPTPASKILGTGLSPTQRVTPTAAPTPTPYPIKTYGRIPATAKFTVAPHVQAAIVNAANEFKVNPELMYDIAYQESKFSPTARAADSGFDGKTIDPKTGQPYPYSSATGLYMFTDGTWDTVRNYANMANSSLTNWGDYDRTDPVANSRAAAYLIAMGQLGKWDASRGYWGPGYTRTEMQPHYTQTPDSFGTFDGWLPE